MLDKIITTTSASPPKIILYGAPGVGKSTFAASANALILDCENGAGNIKGAKRTPYISTWPEARAWLVEIVNAKSLDFEALAIDTIDWLIKRIVEYVTVDLDKKADPMTNTIGSAHGGFFKAREIVSNIINRELFPMLNAINACGLPLILLGHAANKSIKTPEGFDMRLACPDIHEHWLNDFIEWSDAVFYATRTADGERQMQTQGTNIITAKNRYGLPPVVPMNWQQLISQIGD